MQINEPSMMGIITGVNMAPPLELKKKPTVEEPKDEVQISEKPAPPPKYDFTKGNYVQPLETGGGKDEIMPKITELVSGAKTAVQVQMYRLGHPKIIDVLTEQARKGVRVQVLLDPSEGYNEADAKEQAEIRKYLESAGVEVLRYPIDGPSGKIDHVKMLIVDGKSLLIGGMNWDKHSPLNKDYDILVRGPAVGQAQEIFNDDWKLAGGNIIPGLKAPGPQPDANAEVRLLTTEVDRKDINTALQENIKNAKKSIKMEAYSLADKTTIANLIEAKKRGVDVKIILDPNLPVAFVNKKSADQLAAAGVEVKWRNVDVEKREKLHAKLAMFDDDRVIIGSCNFTKNGLYINHEASAEVISKAVGLAFNNIFDEHWKNESVDKMPYLADYNETVDSDPPKHQMGREIFRYMTEVFHPGKQRLWTGKNKAAALEAIEKYDKTKEPASLEGILGNSGKEDILDPAQEMEVVGDLASFAMDLPNMRMKPEPGDPTPLYDVRLKIADEASKSLPQRIPSLIKDMSEAIQDKKLKAFVRDALSQVPEGFLKAPSSSSGRYHPADEVDPADVNTSSNLQYGEYKGGGLVLHSRRVQAMAAKLCDHYGIKGKEKDEILAAMALHDVMKGVTMENLKESIKEGKAIEWNDTTTSEHGHVAAEWIKHLDPTGGKMTKNIQKYVANHMSIWNSPESTPPEDLPNFICSMADYIVSQKNFYLEV